MEEIAPWDADPGLVEPAVMVLLKRLADVRHGVVQALDRNLGDSAYGIGCVFHERSMCAISSDAGIYDWLSIVDASSHFVFAINGVPLRIFRAQANEPVPCKARIRGPAERSASQQLLFADMYTDDAADWFWRIRLITDEDEEILKVAFEEVNEYGELRRRWFIDADAIRDYSPDANVRSILREPIDVPDVEVGLPREGVQAAAGRDEILPGADDAVVYGAGDGDE